MNIGYIKLHRSILDWQYWDDHNTTRLLIYFLVSVNYEPKKWKGIDIKAGQLITSYDKISVSTGLTIKQIRRSIKLLVECNEVIQETASKFQSITLVKWEELQVEEIKRAGKGQAKGNEREGQRATTKETKEEKKERINSINIELINIRKIEFQNTLSPFLAEYGKDVLNEFYKYWTEPNRTFTKMRFEMEKTWSVDLRLSNWNKRNANFNINKNGTKPNSSDATVEALRRFVED